MKKFFPERKHISILPHILLSLFILFARFQPVNAADGCYSKYKDINGILTCGILGTTCTSGVNAGLCCNPPSACDTPNPGCTFSDDPNCNIKPPIRHETVTVCTYAGDNAGDCDACLGKNGIWTALGCIPFNQDQFVLSVVKIIMGIAGGITLVMMLVATFMLMTGGGNSEQMKRGKEIFTGAVVGILFLIFSVVILQIITQDIIKIDLMDSNIQTNQSGKKALPI